MILPHELDDLLRALIAYKTSDDDGPTDTRRTVAELIDAYDLTPEQAGTLWRIVAGEESWLPVFGGIFPDYIAPVPDYRPLRDERITT